MIQIAEASGKAPIYRLEIQDIIRDFNGSPHRMIKMVISGQNFPFRNATVFVRIRNGRKVEESWLVELSADGDQIIAFFPVDFTQSGNVEFGYGDELMAVFTNPKWTGFKMLDPKLIDQEVIVINKKWIEKAIAEPKYRK